MDIGALLPNGLDIAPVTALMGLVVVGLSALWGYRKVVKTMNRS